METSISESGKLISLLKKQIEELILKYEQEKQKNELLIAENKKLNVSLTDKTQDVEELEKHNQTLKLANSLVSGEDTHETKIKINRIVREIDKCIALLNR